MSASDLLLDPQVDLPGDAVVEALTTDNPVQMCTTIGREDALAHTLGFSPDELLTFTSNAVKASFMEAERKRALLTTLDAVASQVAG